MDFTGFATAPFDGAIAMLSTGRWFTPGQGFADQSTLVNGSIVPEPGTLALLALAVPAALRRRQR